VTIPCADCAASDGDRSDGDREGGGVGDGVMRRVEAVIDAWFDSGSMPTAQWGYPAVEGSAERFRLPGRLHL